MSVQLTSIRRRVQGRAGRAATTVAAGTSRELRPSPVPTLQRTALHALIEDCPPHQGISFSFHSQLMNRIFGVTVICCSIESGAPSDYLTTITSAIRSATAAIVMQG